VLEQSSLATRFRSIRNYTENLCASLDPEDCVAQSMPDTSPTKWHLAHTTWFFETFVLKEHASGYTPFHAGFGFLFNSYYNGAGERHTRSERGVLTRPTLKEILAYRAHVDEHMDVLVGGGSADETGDAREIQRVTEIGLQHEQQHQELILTDIKHLFAQNALLPAYRPPLSISSRSADELGWIQVPEGVHTIGYAGDGFFFDNERPTHRVFVEPCLIADRLISNGEYREFIADGGYRRPELWLDLGWATVQREGWQRPLYWLGDPDGYSEFTLAGERQLCDAEPVSPLGSPAKPNGRSHADRDPSKAISSIPLDCILQWPATTKRPGRNSSLAISGNGRAVAILPTPATDQTRAHSASTMASSCVTSSFFGEAPARVHNPTSDPAIEISSTHPTAGSSAESALPRS
jgi:hypothetical protein